VVLLLGQLETSSVRADGTETLGPPSISISAGTGIVTGGTGMVVGTGSIEVFVPTDATVSQVLLYWAGFSAQGAIADSISAPKGIPGTTALAPSTTQVSGTLPGQPGTGGNEQIEASVPAPGGASGSYSAGQVTTEASIATDQSVTVNGLPVIGTLIGGPTWFVEDHLGATYRADITHLGVVQPGANTLIIAGLDFTVQNDGAGVVVIFDDGSELASITIRDGHDLAFSWFTPPLNTTVAQTFVFTPAPQQRLAQLELFVGDADPDRPCRLLVTINGVTTTYHNVFESNDGPEWDTFSLPLTIPPQASAVTVQVLSQADGSGAIPASLAWVMAALTIGEGAYDDCDGNLVPDVCDLSCAGLNGDCAAAHPDACGLGDDCDANEVLDACELVGNDCNNNGILDECEDVATCNDGNACTINDVCSVGVCAGTLRDCSHLNGPCTIGVCNPANGSCRAVPANSGGDCSDGIPCTYDDFCWNGVCVGFERDCSPLDDACNVGVCNELTGECEPQGVNDGATCDDGSLCTLLDACAGGACVGEPTDCTGFDDDCHVGVCDPLSGECRAAPANEGGACDDGILCSVGDVCSNGVCAGFAADCSAFDDACNVGVCNELDGACIQSPVNEGGACDDGDDCMVDDTCAGGVCAGIPKDCSALDSTCLAGVCLGTTGICTVSPVNESGACDDGNGCTTGDACADGICRGAPLDCSAHDDACHVGACVGTSGICEALPANNGGPCDDGDLCTVDDTCADGTCAGQPLDCSGLDSACTVGVCHPSTGTCIAQTVTAGTNCDDGDGCTVDDGCANGVCLGTPLDCSEFTDACNVGVCIGTTGVCAAAPANEGGACDDGDGCTVADACSNGICGGAPLDCSGLSDACNLGVCIGTSGVCDVVPVNEGGACDDGAPCTVDDACAGGVCGGQPLDCSTHDDACNLGMCDPATGGCIAQPANEGGTCDDGDNCTVADACSNGVCAGAPRDCSPLDDACNVGVCDPGSGDCVAQATNEGGTCDDGDSCTVEDACLAGVCQGAPLDCSGLDDACNIGVCDPALGSCVAQAANDGGACADGDGCTVNDICAGGACAGVPLDCSTLNDACNVGACVGTTGVCAAVPANEGGACDDGDGCTVDDACASGACAGEPLDCSTLNDACNVGACVGTTGVCAAVPANEGGACDDGDGCTIDDTCTGGACAGSPLDCSPLDDACHVGACVGTTGICAALPANDGGRCDDGDLCTIDDACSNGACHGAPVDCSGLDDACNLGVCVGSTGLCAAVPVNDGGACDDGDLCTLDDACQAGVCAGSPQDCSGLTDACNLGVCVGSTGLCAAIPVNEGGACDDGDGCTVDDTCAGGACVGAPMDCSAFDDACNDGACIGTTGVCAANPANEGGACDDGDLCTIDDACVAGICAGTPRDCSAHDDACNLGVCIGSTGLCAAVPVNDGGVCDDGDECTVDDTCTVGVCGGAPMDCSAFDDACNVGACIGTTGVCAALPANEGGACDDSDECTVDDTCSVGVCGGAPRDCSAFDDACNVGTCIGTSGVCAAVPAHEGESCDDGTNCTVNDVCTAGVCAGEAMICAVGMGCEEIAGACLQLPSGRVNTAHKGSLLIYPKVELRWDESGNLLQDTFLTLTNDYPDSVMVQMYFVQGDPPIAAVTSNGTILEREHPGWNAMDVQVVLTGNQPTYWSAASGQPVGGGVPPFTILDQQLPLGRPDPGAPGERMLRGYIVAWATDTLAREIRWNHLSGTGQIVNYARGASWEYQAYSFQTRDMALPNGELTGTPGELHLDGVEYALPYDLLAFDFFAAVGFPPRIGVFGLPRDTELTLLPVNIDLRQETTGPVTTKATFTVWNANEVKFTGQDRCVTCWDSQWISAYAAPNHLLSENLQTDRGRARIDGVASQVCNLDYDPGDVCTQTLGGPAPECDPRDIVSTPQPLLGVQSKLIEFDGGREDFAGEALVGMGQEGAVIHVDFIGSPPPERPGED